MRLGVSVRVSGAAIAASIVLGTVCASPAVAQAPAAAPTTAPADAPPAAYETYYCSGCHNVDTKGVGPSFKDIAARYRDKPEAATALAVKVKKGGSGVWGPVPMPANPTVPDDELKGLIAWILAQP